MEKQKTSSQRKSAVQKSQQLKELFEWRIVEEESRTPDEAKIAILRCCDFLEIKLPTKESPIADFYLSDLYEDIEIDVVRICDLASDSDEERASLVAYLGETSIAWKPTELVLIIGFIYAHIAETLYEYSLSEDQLITAGISMACAVEARDFYSRMAEHTPPRNPNPKISKLREIDKILNKKSFLKELTSSGGKSRHAASNEAKVWVKGEWTKNQAGYSNNKSDFARNYVKLVPQRFKKNSGDPLQVTEKTIREVWLRDTPSTS